MTDTALPPASAATMAIVSPSTGTPAVVCPRAARCDAGVAPGARDRGSARRARSPQWDRRGSGRDPRRRAWWPRRRGARRRLRRGGQVEALEQGEDGERGEALGGRRKARRLASAIRHAQRGHPVGAMRGEIVRAQRAAGLPGGAGDAPGQVAPVELVRAACRNELRVSRDRAGRSARRRGGRGERSATACAGPRRGPRPRTARKPTPSRAAGRGTAGSPRGHAGSRLQQIAPGDGRAHALGAVAMRVPPAGDHAGRGEGSGPAARRDGRSVARAVSRRDRLRPRSGPPR